MNIKIVTNVSKDNSTFIFRVHQLITPRTLPDPEREGNMNLWHVGGYNLKRRDIPRDLYTAVNT